uniref:Uncharacterized protein n=1 Tax=Anguilla anguilla TaxID=7936 RepID=A0A0E9URU9_ANGAN
MIHSNRSKTKIK